MTLDKARKSGAAGIFDDKYENGFYSMYYQRCEVFMMIQIESFS